MKEQIICDFMGHGFMFTRGNSNLRVKKKKKANRGWAGDQEVGCSSQGWRSNPPALAACQSVFHLVTDPHITADSCSICVTVYVNG